MSEHELSELFYTMRVMFCIPAYMQEFTSMQWKVLKDVWRDVFKEESIDAIWDAVRKYARDGGKFWPYPGEIGNIMREKAEWSAKWSSWGKAYGVQT